MALASATVRFLSVSTPFIDFSDFSNLVARAFSRKRRAPAVVASGILSLKLQTMQVSAVPAFLPGQYLKLQKRHSVSSGGRLHRRGHRRRCHAPLHRHAHQHQHRGPCRRHLA